MSDDQDPDVPAKVLPPDALLRLGALSLQEERSEAVEQLVTDQEQVYRRVLERSGPEPLIEALLARDRHLAQMGRQIADGRTAGRLLREFVRAVLARAELQPGQAEGIAGVLAAMGAEEADRRQVRLHGSTLGPLRDLEAEAEQKAGEDIHGDPMGDADLEEEP